ncbi:hypothetical protein [Rhodomicrobium sp. Az07]|uniref:hypothetical protein n=1 Tax=Rhodomicrobium sp. Az07 TaxID=2839034 RepID=UPI002036EE23|nr:hypothetical protein [Rhodomicrobium sp. Az07]
MLVAENVDRHRTIFAREVQQDEKATVMNADFGARAESSAFSQQEDEFRYVSRAEGVEPTFDTSLAHTQIAVELRRPTLHPA